jgi:peptide/nickel transport system substrate-binding protein
MMSVWFGMDNAVPTPDMLPAGLAPTGDDQLQWPVWGVHYLSGGREGTAPDLAAASDLLALLKKWRVSITEEERRDIWLEMLKIYSQQVFSIGIVNSALQPIVHAARMRNVPEKALYGFEPTSYLGVYMPDAFWYDGDA